MSLEGRSDIVVVSSFGRGNWLAAELASQGLSVSLVEVSEQLGRWTPEDWEGPFGYFQTEKLTSTQRARLIEEDYAEDLPEGFTVWLADGPIDFKSSLSPHLLAESGMDPTSLEFLINFESLAPDQIRQMREKIRRGKFAKNWLTHLSYQLASHVFLANAEGINYGKPLPLASPWLVRRVSRKGAGHSLDWVASKKVKVYSGAELVDLSSEGGRLTSLEVRSSWSGAITAQQFIWALSGEETEKLSPEIGKMLFPKGSVKPTWHWSRFRLRVDKDIYLENLPLKFVLIKDLYVPWSHTNMMIVQRTVQSEDLDVWIRIPTQHRFQRAYLEEMSQDMVSIFNSKIPSCKAVLADMPQDYLYEYKEMGPPRFPIYLREDLETMNRSRFPNLFYSGSEDSVLMEWSSILRDQSLLVDKILKWKKELEMKMAKEART